MKIEKIDQNQLIITLSPTEILQINLEFDTKEPKNLLDKLLHLVEKECDFSIMNEKFFLEMIPSQQDGCNIFITKANEKKQTDRQDRCLSIAIISDWKTAEYTVGLLHETASGESALYRLDGVYYFVLYTKTIEEKKKMQMRLSDLGEWLESPELFEGVLKEYGVFLTYLNNFSEFLQKTVK